VTRVDLTAIPVTGDRINEVLEARDRAAEHAGQRVRIAYLNLDKQRRFLTATIVTVARPIDHTNPVEVAVHVPGDMVDLLIRVNDLLSLEVLT
jgi:hypothetical protein